MDETLAREAAALIAGNRLKHARLAALPARLVPCDEAAGYRVQALVHAALHDSCGALSGHKIGCTTKVMQEFLKIDQPCAGRVFAAHVHHGSAQVRRDDYVRPGVECEIAVVLETNLPATGAPYSRSSVAAAVGGVMAAIEIVDDRYRDFRTVGVPTLIADDFFHSGCVLGDRVTDWRRLDLASLAGATFIDGVQVGRGSGASVMGHPLNALAWLANARSKLGLEPLRRGEFVLLGSLVETQWLNAGMRTRIEIEQLGALELAIDP